MGLVPSDSSLGTAVGTIVGVGPTEAACLFRIDSPSSGDGRLPEMPIEFD